MMTPAGSLDESDDALVQRVLGGDVAAFAGLLRRHEQQVRRVVSVMLRDAAATDNLVQQVFLQAYRKLHYYEIGRDFSRWLHTLARNMTRNEIRHAAFEHRCYEEYRAYVTTTIENDESTAERARRVDEAMVDCRRHLSSVAEQALVLKYEDARSLDEVAAALGRTVGATRQLLFRAREALRVCVQQRLAVE